MKKRIVECELTSKNGKGEGRFVTSEGATIEPEDLNGVQGLRITTPRIARDRGSFWVPMRNVKWAYTEDVPESREPRATKGDAADAMHAAASAQAPATVAIGLSEPKPARRARKPRKPRG